MVYKFENKKKNYSVFASGSVLKSFPGQPAFPVRLVSELFQRCTEILKLEGKLPPYSIYDPFCGSGYLITSLAFIHGNEMSNIFGSDINLDAVSTARNNLNLLTVEGLEHRKNELQALYSQFKKESHLEGVENARHLSERYLSEYIQNVHKNAFQADALNKESIEKAIFLDSIDIIITDVPYGKQTEWVIAKDLLGNDNNPIFRFLNIIKYFMKSKGLIVLINQSQFKLASDEPYIQKYHFKIGHRHIYILQIKK